MMLRRPVASDTLFWSRKAAWCVCEFVMGLNQIRKNIAPENWNKKTSDGPLVDSNMKEDVWAVAMCVVRVKRVRVV